MKYAIPQYEIKVHAGRANNPSSGAWLNLSIKDDVKRLKELMTGEQEYIISDIDTDLRLREDDLFYTDLIKLQKFISENEDKYKEIVAVSYSVDIRTLDKFIDDCNNSNIFYADPQSSARIETQFIFDKIENAELWEDLQRLQKSEMNYAIDYDALWRNLEITNNITLVSFGEKFDFDTVVVEIY